MAFGVSKVLDELKGRNCGKYNVDKIEDMINTFRHPPMGGELPPEEDGVAVVEITTTEPVEEEVLEEKPEEGKSEEENIEEEINSEDDTSDNGEEDGEAAAPELPASEGDDGKLEPPTPAEQDRMDEVLKAIKTFFPNENTEDVLVRMVTKLIDL